MLIFLALSKDEPSMNLDDAVVVRTYSSEPAARLAESRLGCEGVEAEIQKDDCGGAYPSLQMSQGVRLLVHANDLEIAEQILKEMTVGRLGKAGGQRLWEVYGNDHWNRTEALAMKQIPSQQLEELKSVIFPYVVIAPLLAALFADKIDNIFVACLLFVALVGTGFIYLRNQLGKLEESLKEQERRIAEFERQRNRKYDY